MSLAATVKAMAAAGFSADQIADVISRMEADARAGTREGNARRQRELRERRKIESNACNAVTDVTDVTRNAVTGVTSVTSKERPHTPKENPPPPSPPKGGSVGAPQGAPPASRSTRLAPDWQPSAEDRDFARRRGFDDASIDLEVEKIRNWSASSPKGACRDWAARWRNWVLQATPPARAGPPPQRRGRTVAEMAQMSLDDDGFLDERADTCDGPTEGPSRPDQGRSGFAGRLSIADAAVARRDALVDR